jgi:hypothetical protein
MGEASMRLVIHRSTSAIGYYHNGHLISPNRRDICFTAFEVVKDWTTALLPKLRSEVIS